MGRHPEAAVILAVPVVAPLTHHPAGRKVNIYFIAVPFALLMLLTYVPAVPTGLVQPFYR
ncbi:MAG: hypothetical protein V3T27_00145 [Alphaproteobacteria bacterium]